MPNYINYLSAAMDNLRLNMVITKSNSVKLHLCLSYIEINNRFYTLVIDDSCRNDAINDNQKIIRSFQNNKVLHINKHNIKRILDSTIRKTKASEIFPIQNLGLNSWNTPNVRNLGLLLRNLFFPMSQVEAYDDDIIEITKPISPLTTINELRVFPLLGCPDMLRLEWIGLFLYSLDNRILLDLYKFGILRQNFSEEMLKNSNYLLTRFTRFASNPSSKTFDDLIIGQIGPGKDNGTGHGGRFSFNHNCTPLFMPFVNEDIQWLHQIKLRSHSFHISNPVYHLSNKRLICSTGHILKEVEGEIANHYMHLKVLKSCNVPLSILDFFVEKEINRFGRLISIIDNMNVNNPAVKSLNHSLRFVKKVLTDSFTVEKLKWHMAQYILRNIAWENYQRRCTQFRKTILFDNL